MDGRAGRNAQRANRRRTRRPLARLLLAAIDEGAVEAGADADADADYAAIETDELVQAASSHKIAPALYVHLKRVAGPNAASVNALRGAYRLQAALQMQIGLDVAWLARVMAQLGVPWAVVKGPVMSEIVWSRPDLRQFSDLDVVVSRHDLGAVLDALEAAGGTILEKDWAAVRRQVRGELSVQMPGSTALDLHWHVVNSPQLRRVFRFPIAQMLERTVNVTVAGVEVPTFDPADTLLHLAYHTVHSGGHRLVWLKDIERASRHPGLNWEVVAERARQYGLGLALTVALDRADRTLGRIPRPRHLKMGRGGWLWRAMCRISDGLWSAPMLPGDRLSGQILYKSVRSTSWQSARAAVWAAMHGRRSNIATGTPIPPHVRDADQMKADYIRVLQETAEP